MIGEDLRRQAKQEAALSAGLTNDFRVIPLFILAGTCRRRVRGQPNSSVPSSVGRSSAGVGQGLGGRGLVVSSHPPPSAQTQPQTPPSSHWSTIAVTFRWKHCGIMATPLFWFEWGSSWQTRGLTDKEFWEFLFLRGRGACWGGGILRWNSFIENGD